MNIKLKLAGVVALGVVFAMIGGTVAAQEITITVKPGDKPKVEVVAGKQAPFTGVRPAVDVAILLDTSNSMDGLIDQAKSQLWTIVQQFAKAEKDGKTPELRVSVFEYGNTSLPASEDYIRQVIQLTGDLDEVSEALFSLKTNGGDEYCGAVIGEAVKRLDWSDKDNSYKTIFIAGNEPFTQGSIDYKDTCKDAIEKGIVINTIHCGGYDTGISTKWKDGADLAEGKYMNIDQDRKVVHIKTPHDEIIIKLNAELNKTYLWYGKAELQQKMKSNQARQDANAAQAGASSLLSRAQTKGGKMYNYSNRDLVDSFAADESIIDEVDEESLPEGMQGMSIEERAVHVKEMAGRRKEIQSKIAAATVEREKVVAAKKKEMAAATGDVTLGDAMSAAVHEQLQSAGFELKR